MLHSMNSDIQLEYVLDLYLVHILYCVPWNSPRFPCQGTAGPLHHLGTRSPLLQVRHRRPYITSIGSFPYVNVSHNNGRLWIWLRASSPLNEVSRGPSIGLRKFAEKVLILLLNSDRSVWSIEPFDNIACINIDPIYYGSVIVPHSSILIRVSLWRVFSRSMSEQCCASLGN